MARLFFRSGQRFRAKTAYIVQKDLPLDTFEPREALPLRINSDPITGLLQSLRGDEDVSALCLSLDPRRQIHVPPDDIVLRPGL